ncbi:cyclic nucleotide-binding domain-containing protein [Amycolatopsis anabasis]|uniref:cyclic nucleotide-binding domain-containing protein n=1 Tax=Amycolatopsis anabasis TaxID=1840409 RepID=UPI00131DD76B|nr:cyclic nucleotide-binding domain-containing protein [Amycolatopsis anabasis]
MKNVSPPPEIAKLPLFRQLSAEETAKVLRYGRRVTFPQGWPLISEGTPGDAAYILLEGQLTVWLGRELVATLDPGTIVGETSLQQDTLRAATVSAATPVLALRLSSRKFGRLVAKLPAFARAVDEAIAGRTTRD